MMGSAGRSTDGGFTPAIGCRASVVLLLIAFLTLPASVGAMEVIYASNHPEPFSPFDTGFAGFSEFGRLAKKNGLSVSVATDALDELLPGRANGTILVLLPPLLDDYTPAERTAVRGFLERGGAVLALVEHDDRFGHATRMNRILEEFGVRAENGQVLDPTNSLAWSRGQYIQPQTRTAVNTPTLFLAAPLTVADPGSAIAWVGEGAQPPNTTVAAAVPVGAGVLLVVADTEFLWNGNDRIGIDVGSNRAFAVELLEFLARTRLRTTAVVGPHLVSGADRIPLQSTNETVVRIVDASGLTVAGERRLGVGPSYIEVEPGRTGAVTVQERIEGGWATAGTVVLERDAAVRGRVLVLEAGDALAADGSVSGLGALAAMLRDRGYAVDSSPWPIHDLDAYSLVVVAAPLAEAADEWRPLVAPGAPKLLLVGAVHSSVAGDSPQRRTAADILDASERSYPLDRLARSFGIDFLPAWTTTLDGDREVPLEIAGNGLVRARHVGAVASGARGAPPLIRVQAPPDFFADDEGLAWFQHPIRRDGDDRPSPTIVLGTDRVFALAAPSLLSNERIDGATVDLIVSWLEHEPSAGDPSSVPFEGGLALTMALAGLAAARSRARRRCPRAKGPEPGADRT